jgi:hypothetical protein
LYRYTEAADQFRAARSAVMMSSDVTARGIDFPDVTLVIQVGLALTALLPLATHCSFPSLCFIFLFFTPRSQSVVGAAVAAAAACCCCYCGSDDDMIPFSLTVAGVAPDSPLKSVLSAIILPTPSGQPFHDTDEQHTQQQQQQQQQQQRYFAVKTLLNDSQYDPM